ncbi:MAG TPA: copper chaperone [Chitinophagaceae bacterium]
MKKLMPAIVFCLFSTIMVNAQAPKAQWVTIKSSNLKCWDCKKILDEYLTRANGTLMEKGMITWRYNLIKGEIKVQYYPDRTNPNLIRTVIANAGFDADEIKATPESYNLLPPNCKRAEDGGGPKKGKPCHMEPVN